MASQLIASHRENAVVVTGNVAIKKKMSELLKNAKLPLGVMPVDEVVELGHNPSTGFFWATRKKMLEHFFKGISKKATFDTEVTGFLEERKMKKITGVKVKLLFWVTLTDLHINDPASGKIIFTSAAGLTKTFPISPFEEEEEKVEIKKVEEEKVVEPVKEVEVKVEEEKVAEPVKEVEVKKMEEAKKEVEVKN